MLPLELSHAVIASEISSPTEMMTILLNGEPGWSVQQKKSEGDVCLTRAPARQSSQSHQSLPAPEGEVRLLEAVPGWVACPALLRCKFVLDR